MALKGSRYELYTDIQNFMASTAERGGIAVVSTVGSGATLDQSAQLVTYAANSSGQSPRGILLNDMVNIDQTRQHINWHRDEVNLGGKVTLGRKGFWVTNMIVGTPTKGDIAVLTSSGYIMPVTNANVNNGTWNKANNPYVGRFDSILDEDGFAQVNIEL